MSDEVAEDLIKQITQAEIKLRQKTQGIIETRTECTEMLVRFMKIYDPSVLKMLVDLETMTVIVNNDENPNREM